MSFAFFSLIFFRVQEPAGSRVGERPLGVPDFTDSAAFTHLWTPVLQKWWAAYSPYYPKLTGPFVGLDCERSLKAVRHLSIRTTIEMLTRRTAKNTACRRRPWRHRREALARTASGRSTCTCTDKASACRKPPPETSPPSAATKKAKPTPKELKTPTKSSPQTKVHAQQAAAAKAKVQAKAAKQKAAVKPSGQAVRWENETEGYEDEGEDQAVDEDGDIYDEEP